MLIVMQHRRTLTLVASIAVALALLLPQAALAIPAGPEVFQPDSAPYPPYVRVYVDSDKIRLEWYHEDPTTGAYEIRRSSTPYFDPNGGQGVVIDSYSFNPAAYGVNTLFKYLDDGVCGRYTAPSSAPTTCRYVQNPTVDVTGDVQNHYFWAVRAGSSSQEFDYVNRVGEFDFKLVPGS